MDGKILYLRWHDRYLRLAKDYERSLESSEAMIQIAMIRLMLALLARELQSRMQQQQHSLVLEGNDALVA